MRQRTDFFLGRYFFFWVSIFILSIFSASPVMSQRTINVPADYPTIQAGIDAATNGDEVVVAPGTYTERITISKDITVRSSVRQAAVIQFWIFVQIPPFPSVITFSGNVSRRSILRGFEVRPPPNQPFPPTLGGIDCTGASPTILDNHVHSFRLGGVVSSGGNPLIAFNTIGGNTRSDMGGGVRCIGGAPILSHNIISGNAVKTIGGIPTGGGLYFESCLATLHNNKIEGNVAEQVYFFSRARGGGLACVNTRLEMKNCTVVGNSARAASQNPDTRGGGLWADSPSNITIVNSIFWNNDATFNPEIDGTPTVTFSDIRGGWTGSGNINADPLFIDGRRLSQRQAGQLRDSPCLDAGSALASALGLGTYTTRTDAVPDAGIVDMGFHYPITTPSILAALFDTFLYQYSTPSGLYQPSPSYQVCCPSPNISWHKVLWRWSGTGFPDCDLLPENVATTGTNELILSVSPYTGQSGERVKAAQIESTASYGPGSYRIYAKSSAPTVVCPAGNRDYGVVNGFFYALSGHGEIDVEIRSKEQWPQCNLRSGLIEFAVHSSGQSLSRPVGVSFDPSLGFHEYGFDWRSDRVEFFVDGELVAAVTKAQIPIPFRAGPVLLNNWTGLTSSFSGKPPASQSDMLVSWVSYSPVYFYADVRNISVRTGGSSNLFLEAGRAEAQNLYVIVANFTRTNLGTVIGPTHIPIDFDPVTNLFFELYTTPICVGFVGQLDAGGRSRAQLVLPAGIDSSFIGLHLQFCYLTADSATVRVASNPVHVTLVP